MRESNGGRTSRRPSTTTAAEGQEDEPPPGPPAPHQIAHAGGVPQQSRQRPQQPPPLLLTTIALANDSVKSAGTKLSAKRQAGLWNTPSGQKCFSLRGGYFIGIEIHVALIQMISTDNAHIIDKSAEKIRALATKWQVDNFSRRSRQDRRLTPSAMSAEVYFGTTIEVLMTAIEFGVEDAPLLRRGLVAGVRLGLEAVHKQLGAYLQLHYTLVAPVTGGVHDTIIATTAWTRASTISPSPAR